MKLESARDHNRDREDQKGQREDELLGRWRSYASKENVKKLGEMEKKLDPVGSSLEALALLLLKMSLNPGIRFNWTGFNISYD